MQRTSLVFLFLATLAAAPAWAQRAGGTRSGSSGGGARPTPAQSPEEAARAANAEQWQDVVEQVRANSPPPPLPTIHFPTKNESFLGSLRWAENPKQELARYLDKLWKEGKEPTAQRAAVAGLWQDAEKPLWARAAIEDFYRQRSSGQALRTAPEPATLGDAAPAAAATAATTAAGPATAASAAAASPAATPTAAAPSAAPTATATPAKRAGERSADKP